MSKIDLSQFELSDVAKMEVELPNGNPMLIDGKPVTISFYGAGSKQYLNAKYKRDNAIQTKTMAIMRGKGGSNNAEENEKINTEFLVACVESIEPAGINAGDLFGNPKLGYVKEQADKFLGDTENFMQK